MKKCIHNKILAYCKECGGSQICEHNRQRSRCIDCGGGSICQHNKVRSRCRECDGNSFCQHNREKYSCKECGGSQICQHNKIKSTCKDCGGSQICQHNRDRSRCKDCSGGSICHHNKRRSCCIECGGGECCEHNKIKSKCRECGGSSFCQHNRRRNICKECSGGSLCQHNRQRSYCKDCGGGGICEHNRIRSKCKECDGGSICQHNKLKSHCKVCGGSVLCKSEWCETYSNKKYNKYCYFCYVHLFPDEPKSKNYKTKEISVVEFIKSHFPHDNWVCDKKIYDGKSRRRPDILLALEQQYIIIEIDENQHCKYDCSCENKRLMELSLDVNHKPIVFIRFNPDLYVNEKNEKIGSCWVTSKTGVIQIQKNKTIEWETRLENLKKQIEYWKENTTNKMVEVIQLYYDANNTTS